MSSVPVVKCKLLGYSTEHCAGSIVNNPSNNSGHSTCDLLYPYSTSAANRNQMSPTSAPSRSTSGHSPPPPPLHHYHHHHYHHYRSLSPSSSSSSSSCSATSTTASSDSSSNPNSNSTSTMSAFYRNSSNTNKSNLQMTSISLFIKHLPILLRRLITKFPRRMAAKLLQETPCTTVWVLRE